MSSLLFMLESHLTDRQLRALTAVQEAASAAECNLFLTGGAMRDVLCGMQVRDLEFVVEGSATKLAKTVAGATLLSAEEPLKQARIGFGCGLEAKILTARVERYAKAGGKPQLTQSSIHEHLLNRDFTVNTIALSLSRASRGLLLDPNNGRSDLERKELRAVSNYGLYDQPIRLFQLIRLRAQLGFTVADRTWAQFENARGAGVEQHIPGEALLGELMLAARDANPGAIVEAWAAEGLLSRISPAVSGLKLNSAGFAKLVKARQAIPYGTELEIDDLSLFLWTFAEKLTPKERTELAETLAMPKEIADAWLKLESKATKLGKEVEAVHKASAIWAALHKVPAERVLMLLMLPVSRNVQERVRNYFGKYLPMSLEVTDADVVGLTPGTPKFEKKKAELIAKKLDARPKKVVVEAVEVAPVPPPPPPAPFRSTGPRGRSAG